MGDIKSPLLLYIKGGLFVVIGVIASGMLLFLHPGWLEAFLLAMAVWGFARAYYFAFYVVEHYADPEYKFSGLSSFARYVVRRWRRSEIERSTEKPDGGSNGL